MFPNRDTFSHRKCVNDKMQPQSTCIKYVCARKILLRDAGGSPFWCSHIHSCVNWCLRRVPMHDSLEIKTLCGTWLMIRRELKQQAEETTEKKRREKEKERGQKERETSARSRIPDCLCCTPCSRFLGCAFIRVSGRPFPLAHFC